MTISVDDVLASTPYWHGKDNSNPGGLQHDLVLSAVRDVALTKSWPSGGIQALRVFAVASYWESASDSELSALLTGPDDDLARDVLAELSSFGPLEDDDVDLLIDASLAGRTSPDVSCGNIDEGRIRALLEFVKRVRPGVVALLLAKDTSNCVLRWLLHGWSTSAQEQAYADALGSTSRERDWRAAAAFLANVARENVLSGGARPVFTGADEVKLVIGGLVMAEVAQMRYLPILQRPVEEARWETLSRWLSDEVSKWMKSTSDVRSLVSGEEKDSAAIIALLLGCPQNTQARKLARAGDGLLDTYFRRLDSPIPRSSDESLPYLSHLVAMDLLEIWVRIGADATRFESLRSKLRCDEYAFQFNYGHYLLDRARAIVLAAIGAIAADRLGDASLRESASSLARDLADLPPGVVEAVSQKMRTGIASMGIDLSIA